MPLVNIRLKQAREFRNLSQSELARRLGVSRGAVNRWERGRGLPSVDYAIEIAKNLELSLDDIFLPKGVVKNKKNKQNS